MKWNVIHHMDPAVEWVYGDRERCLVWIRVHMYIVATVSLLRVFQCLFGCVSWLPLLLWCDAFRSVVALWCVAFGCVVALCFCGLLFPRSVPSPSGSCSIELYAVTHVRVFATTRIYRRTDKYSSICMRFLG
jgi:hypothetical protein